MASSPRHNARLAHLWQVPLLILSVSLFAYAAYLFIDPKPGLTIDQKIEQGREFLRLGRPTAAIGHLNQILSAGELARENESQIHLMLAEAIEATQRQQKLDVAVNYERIIEQSRLALAQGIKPQADVYRRLGDSYSALGKTDEALESYRRAIAMDAGRALDLQRKVIDLQLSQADTGPAAASLDEYIKDARLADGERAWALGRKAQLLADRKNFIEARTLLAEALRSDPDPAAQGQYHYSLGYCAWKLGDNAEAERYLRVARDQLTVRHPLDADAAYTLGRIRQDAGDAPEAASFFQAVLVSHPDAPIAPLSRLGRGVCRIVMGDDDAGLTDLHDLTAEVESKASRRKFKSDLLAGLRDSSAVLTKRGNLQGALELMAYEQQLHPKPEAEFFKRLAGVYERRGAQVDEGVNDDALNAAERLRLTQHVRELRTKAADAWIAYSRAVTLDDDKAFGDALWRGVGLYDKAGDMPRAIAALELFVAERPDDGATPDALLRLGKMYQAAGLFDKAVSAYQRNQTRYPQSLAASKSGVPLAQSFIAKGPQHYPSAEKSLLRVMDSELLTPAAVEFREALFELAQLYYRTNRYEESVSRLQELTERYPQDGRMGQLVFLMADAYRKSAALLDVTSSPQASASASADGKAGAAASAAVQAEAVAARKERLEKARKLYDHVIEQYRAQAPARDLDRLYLKLSHFYRADCLYDLGQYADAIKLYDSAALKYQNDPSALAAYVQIVNSYCALGKTKEAKTANERAKWLLKKIPPTAFQNGEFSMPKAYWEQWLKWTSQSGLW